MLIHYVLLFIQTMLKQMGGKQAAAIIRQHSQHVPIIFLTGEIAASMKATAKQYEPSHLLLKPCSKKDLIAVSYVY
jgi:CheY-like chemotaxis protein